MKEQLRQQNGITLIALIITIIVLLILAMVSIKLVWDGGIIAHAQNAVNAYNEAQTNELEQLNELMEQMKPLGGNNNTTVNWWELREGEAQEFEKNGSKAENGNIIVADSTMENYIGFYDMSNGDPIDGILMKVQQGASEQAYICYIGDKTVSGSERKKGQWYKLSNGTSGEEIEYTGPSPISLDTFKDGTIYCRSYLERIISSFNN